MNAGRICAPPPVFGTLALNVRALSLFRIFFALLLWFDLLVYVLPHWTFLYGADGAFSAAERFSALSWSLLSYTDNAALQWLLLAVYGAALAGFLLGCRTRLCALIGFLILTVILDRNPAADSNAELLQACLLLWCCFLPLDRHWSLTAASGQSRAREVRWPVIPVVAIKLQILVVYLCSGLFKLASEEWRHGRAIAYALSDNYYGTAAGAWLSGLLEPKSHLLLCWLIILLQLAFSLLVYSPWRNDLCRAVALTGAALTHIGFIFFLQLHLFPFLSLIYLLLLVPDRWLDLLANKRRAAAAAPPGRIYRRAEHCRQRWCAALTPLCGRRPDRGLERTPQFICLFLVTVMLAYTLMALPQTGRPVPAGLANLALQTGVRQTWDLFAPEPVAYTRTLRVRALDADGRPIDVSGYLDEHFYRSEGRVRFFSPRLFKYYESMFASNGPRHRLGYARYLCRRARDDQKTVDRVRLTLSIVHNFDDYADYGVDRTYSCVF